MRSSYRQLSFKNRKNIYTHIHSHTRKHICRRLDVCDAGRVCRRQTDLLTGMSRDEERTDGPATRHTLRDDAYNDGGSDGDSNNDPQNLSILPVAIPPPQLNQFWISNTFGFAAFYEKENQHKSCMDKFQSCRSDVMSLG